MDLQLKAEIFAIADACLVSGQAPTSEYLKNKVAEIEPSQLDEILCAWWQQLPERVHLQDTAGLLVPGVPDAVQQVFGRLWHQAVKEARVELEQLAQLSDPEADERQRECDGALKRARDEVGELEQHCRELQFKLDQAQGRQTALELELQQLRDMQLAETHDLKKEEQLRANAEQELDQLRKTYEDAQRVFDQRVRDEQRHNLEALARAEVDTRHYRNALDKLRDESGRKEADLTRELNELRSRLARTDAKVETLTNQLRNQDEALREFQSQDVQQQREQAQINAQLLTANNRTKRAEEQLRQLEERMQLVNQKHSETNGESARREAQLRAQLQQKEDESLRLQTRAQGFEERVAALEEEIRRLKQRS